MASLTCWETSERYLPTKYCSCLNQGHLSTVCADWKIIVTPRQIFALHLKYLQADESNICFRKFKCNFHSENATLHLFCSSRGFKFASKVAIRGSAAVKLNSNGRARWWCLQANTAALSCPLKLLPRSLTSPWRRSSSPRKVVGRPWKWALRSHRLKKIGPEAPKIFI